MARKVIIERCRNGHPRTPDNTIYERSSNGKLRRRCRECRRISRAARAGGRVGVQLLPLKPIRDYSELNAEESKKTRDFIKAQLLRDPKCLNDDTFWDYGENDSEIPSPEYAREKCAGCPLMDLCNADAEVMQPGWGIQAGQVWAFGHKYNQGEYNGSSSS